MRGLLCFLCIWLNGPFLSFAQDSTKDLLQNSVDRLSEYYQSLPEERIYLHLDKPYYAVGDAIWFKAYVTLGNGHLLSAYSKILYVDLLAQNGEKIKSLRLPITGGISFGDFELTDSLQAGNYKIKAYTQWMRNFSPDCVYERSILIGRIGLNDNEITEKDASANDPGLKTDIREPDSSTRIFLEGGKFQRGVRNEVVLNRPEAAKGNLNGWLVDQQKTRVAEIALGSDSLGRFSFTPAINQTYQILLEDSQGMRFNSEIKVDSLTDYSLKVNNFVTGSVVVQLGVANKKLLNQQVYLVVQHKGEVYYVSKIMFSDNEMLVRIPKPVLGTGIREIGVFTLDMQPLISRSIFVLNEKKRLPLDVSFDKPSYHTHEKVRVKIVSGEENDSLRVSSLSASVVNADQVPMDSLCENNIFTGVLLGRSADVALPWMVPPEDAFKQTKLLDNYMITLPWESVWARLDSASVRYPMEQDMVISGQVTRYKGKPEPGASVTLFSPNAGIMIDTVADDSGRFVFDRLLFYDSVSFVIQARTAKGRKHVDIHLDNIPSEYFKHSQRNNEVSVSVGENMKKYLNKNQDYYKELYSSGRLGNSILLNEVEITTSKNEFEHSSNLNGPGNADQIITSENLSSCSNLAICLQGRLMGVIFKNGIPYSTRSMNTPMLVIVDGMPMEGDILSMISPMDVDFIEVLRRPGSAAVYGSMGSGGVILITTKQGGGSYEGSEFTPGVVTYSPQGFYQIRTFPDTNPSAADPIFDRRTTVFWEPNIVTDENGDAYLEFFTGGRPGLYRIVVEGIDLQGRLGRAVSTVEVRD